MKINQLGNDIKKTIVEKRPEILMGLGIAGMLTSTVMAIKATPKACQILEEEKQARQLYEGDKISNIDIFKLCWKQYIPSTVMFGLSTACLIGSNSTHTKRSAALAVAYGISERTLNEYKDKVIEVFGEEREKEVRDAISRDRVNNEPTKEVIIAGSGDVLCYDTISGRYFKSDMDKLKKAENKLNYEILHNVYYSLNDFYDELDLAGTDVGKELGWNVDDGLIELYFSSQLADNGVPCIVINYSEQPKYGYYKMS